MEDDRSSAHLPERVPIEGYGRGGFRFGGMSHRGSLLCLPSGLWRWTPTRPAEIDAAALERLFAEADRVDMLVLGTGLDLVPIDEALRWRLRDVGVAAETMSTGAAIRTWNLLLGEGRRVAAGLLAVD